MFVGNGNGNIVTILIKYYEARRVTQSVTGAELIAFSDMFYAAFTLREELEVLHLCQVIALQLSTDWKTLFDVYQKDPKRLNKG